MKAITWRRIVLSLVLAAGLYAISSCGGGGGGGSTGPNLATGSTWNAMLWDYGHWN